MVNLLPAIIIGGPPHAGKSVLFTSLTRVLGGKGIAHHAVRACPDGEGNWSQEIDQEQVRIIRIKGEWSDTFLEGICRDLERRQLPLLVDMGGWPTEQQACILQYCTHSLLLLRADKEENARLWHRLTEENGLLPLALLSSESKGVSVLTSKDPIIEGTITHLERGSLANGPVFDALIERIASLFAYPHEELVQKHLMNAPTELVVRLDTLLKKIAPLATEWEPGMIPAVFEELPAHTALSVYDRAPHWLYGTLAAYSGDQPFYQFDPRIGWMRPPLFQLSADLSLEVISTPHVFDTCTVLSIQLKNKHLDYLQADHLPFPTVDSNKGLILDGQTSSWMITALVRLYQPSGLPWIACHQPRLRGAVIVTAHQSAYAPGDVIPMPKLS